MRRIDLDYLLITAMLLSGLYVLLTGLVTDLWGTHQFAFHRYAGYLCAALVGLHLLLNWGRLTAYLRWRLKTLAGREAPDRQRNPSPLTRRDFLLALLGAASGYTLGRLAPTRGTPELALERGDLGWLYHQWSTPGNLWSMSKSLKWGGQPARYKTYADARQIQLPDPRGYRGLTLEEAIEQRRSHRDFTGQPATLEELARLLHARRSGFRAAPSAGALYPIEVYPVVHNVAGLEAGIYHYAVREHALELLKPGDFRSAVMRSGLWQEFLAQANVCLVLAAIFQRTLYLAATSMGMGACAVGAFHDDEFNKLLGLEGEEETALYLLAVGKV